jgi:hypothetical protein
MNNKEILPNNGLPVYDVEEMSLLDAMILLKRNGGVMGGSTIERAVERLNSANQPTGRDTVRPASSR